MTTYDDRANQEAERHLRDQDKNGTFSPMANLIGSQMDQMPDREAAELAIYLLGNHPKEATNKVNRRLPEEEDLPDDPKELAELLVDLVVA